MATQIPRLDPALQEEIDGLQTKHTELIDAIRGYSGGSVAQAANSLLLQHASQGRDTRMRESAMLDSLKRGMKHEPSLLLDFKSETYLQGVGGLDQGYALGELVKVERSTPKWVMGPRGKLVEVPPNEPAYEYDPVTGECLGLLIEGEGENLLSRSEEAWLSPWSSGRPKYFNNEISTSVPFLSRDSASFYGPEAGDSSFSTSVSYQNLHIEPGKYTLTALLKSVNPNGLVAEPTVRTLHRGTGDSTGSSGNLLSRLYGGGGPRGSTSDKGSGMFGRTTVKQCTPVADGWYFYEEELEIVTGGDMQLRLFPYDGGSGFDGDGKTGVLRSRMMLEPSSSSTSYIPTNGSPASRDADNVFRELGDEINPGGPFTVYGEYAGGGSDNQSAFFIFGPGGLSDSFRVGFPSNAGRAVWYSSEGYSTRAITLSEFSDYTEGDPCKFAITCDGDWVTMSINGESAMGPMGGSQIPAFERMNIGAISGTGTNNIIDAAVGNLTYYPYAMTAEDLQELTQNG